MKPINIGLLGLGTVGCGVIELLKTNQASIQRKLGREVRVVAALVQDLNKSRNCNIEDILITIDPKDILEHRGIDIVIEVLGGTEPALSWVLRAIEKKKAVITANKALIALHGNEIFEKAKTKSVPVMYEASVAGGIPIIKMLREGLSGNEIESIAGIINGTCNFILSSMLEEKCDFETALQTAQTLGFAEANPILDINGTDAAHKLAILSSIAFGISLQFNKIYVEGIERVSQYDLKTANSLGYVIKHVAMAKKQADIEGWSLQVYPMLLPKSHLLADVRGAMNAIVVQANGVGSTLYYGQGAGAGPTASAILADILDISRAIDISPDKRVPYLGFGNEYLVDGPILNIDKSKYSYYLCVYAIDRLGTLANLAQILASSRISIDTIMQKHEEMVDGIVPIVILTHPTLERQMNQAISDINALPVIKGQVQRLRIECMGQEASKEM